MGQRRSTRKIGATANHRANRLLAALEPADCASLEPYLQIVDLPQGTILYETGEILRYTYFPHDAVVSLVTVMADGSSAEMAVFGREALFGLVSALITRESLGRYIVHLPGTASRIEMERMRKAIATHPAMQRLFLQFTEALFATVLQTVACNAVHGVEARCCRWLLSTCDRIEQDTLPLTHEVLAEMLGVQRSTVSAVTRDLQTAGLIRQGRGVITVTAALVSKRLRVSATARFAAPFERLLPCIHSAN